MLAYVADFGAATAPVPAAIVACVPKTLHADGVGDVPFQISPEDIVGTILEGLNEPIFPEPEVGSWTNRGDPFSVCCHQSNPAYK